MHQRENNFTYMLIALAVFLIGVPAAYDLQLLSVPAIRALGVSALISIGIWSFRGTGRRFGVGMVLAATGLLLNLVDATRDDSLLFLAANFATLAFLVFTTIESFRTIATTNSLSSNRIVGAICVYLLLGVIWSISYDILEFLIPNSFAGLSTDPGTEWIYYSFVTLTTLGYGDILPLSFLARALAYTEAVVGQFYVAILVAGLVSGYMADSKSAPPND